MPQVTVTVNGMPAAVESLDRRHGPRLDRSIGRASIAALRAIKPSVQAAVPVRSGRARRAVRVARATRDAKPGAYIGLRRDLPYRGPLVRRHPVIVRVASAHQGTIFAVFWTTLRAELNK